MNTLSDHDLLDVYRKAVYFRLSEDFIELIAIELRRRNLQVSEQAFIPFADNSDPLAI